MMLAVLSGCGGGLGRFPNQEPMWEDPDQQSVSQQPDEYFSPFAWDAADQTLFRPVSRFFAVDPAGEAVNVNAMDEVPDSSWFTNRIGARAMSSAELARGACPELLLDPEAGPWTATDAKPNGANPGFIIEGPDGRKYLLKFDGLEQPERGTAADVIGSLIYHAAGYFTPCNRVVFFDRGVVEISPDAESEDESGNARPMVEADLDMVFSKAVRLSDGRYRGSASLFLDGRPVGPWRYQGTRSDDPNDVVAHEDRRDLRGMYVLASWLNHFDSREQNTLATWVEGDGERGHLRHNMIDFGDCLGSLWDFEGISRRLGHAYYLDFPYLVEDFLTLGLMSRPWDEPRYGRAGATLAYYGVERFVPDRWRPGYPNPAFQRMSERDAAWMARIIAQLGEDELQTIVEMGRFSSAVIERELMRILLGRRQRILDRWLAQLSALTAPSLEAAEDGSTELCMTDLALREGVFDQTSRRYAGRAFLGESLEPKRLPGLSARHGAQVCAPLPSADGAGPDNPQYLVIDIAGYQQRSPVVPTRVHLYHMGEAGYRIVGLERPSSSANPALR